jgi:outer membrane protein OmpA-like peptidoglycan-associated protein
MKKIYIPLITLIVICFNVLAQEKSYKEINGDKSFFNYSFDKAIKSYTSDKHLSVEGQRKLAESYHKIDQNIKSEEAYSILLNEPKGIIPEDYYNYAMVLKMNSKYDESNKWMNKFAELKPQDLRVKDYLANSSKLTKLQKDNGEYVIEHQNVNTDALDFGTSYYKNKIVFASTRTNHKMCVRKYNWTKKPFWDIYIAEVDKGQLENPEIFNKRLNGSLHDGPACFSNDGNFMAFTRNNYHVKSKVKVVELQIWFSSFNDGKWSKPTPFAYNKTAYSVGQPCLTSDGNTMYFTSDMPGGYGGTDIYKITKVGNGEWGIPVNLGDKINTEGDEMFPFLEEKSGTFFFSSNGRFGLGGLDIFISTLNGTEFSQPYNAGFPLNTQFDDFAAIVDDKMNKGYFSTNRSGGSGGDDIYSLKIGDPDVRFSANVPKDVPVIRKIRETFPLRNYIFFTLGSTEIPDRYVLLTKDQAKYFKEEHLEEFTSKNPTGRSKRQMSVYYNVINILGDRMDKNPLATITLVGSSANGPKDGTAMAETVKRYLVDVFSIKASRINIEGLDKPKIPSEQPGGVHELVLLREGDQRVSIESSSPDILMEFQSGPNAPLKPVEIVTTEEFTPNNSVSFNAEGAKVAFTSWSLELRDEKGKVQSFGPFTEDKINISRESIMGDQLQGNYTATMIGKTKIGKTIKKDTLIRMELAVTPKIKEVMRFSIIFEFDDSRAIAIYEKYLTNIVTPKIPIGGKVIIRGYTDIIGDFDHNQRLSLARANDVKSIMEASLVKAGRTDVTFEVTGYGEDEKTAPFENINPEERFYNRTVIIDIVPKQ